MRTPTIHRALLQNQDELGNVIGAHDPEVQQGVWLGLEGVGSELIGCCVEGAEERKQEGDPGEGVGGLKIHYGSYMYMIK